MENEKISVIVAVLIVLAGMFIYNVLEIISGRFSDTILKVWWLELRVRFIMSAMVISIFFYLMYTYEMLEVAHCFYLGVVGNLIIDKILQAINGKAKRNRDKN